MRSYLSSSLQTPRHYVLAGVAFGLCFPLAAWALELAFIHRWPWTPANLWLIHVRNPLHWIIDLAPLVLGFVAYELGKRHRIEEALREAEKRFRNAFHDAPLGMALIAPNGRWLQVNRALSELTGYAEAELLQTDFETLTLAEDRPADQASLRALSAGDFSFYQLEKRFLHRAGQPVWVVQSLSLVRDDAGAPLYFVSHIEDITGRKQAEQALRDSADRYRQMFEEAERLRVFNASIAEAIAESLVLEDPDGRITLVNPPLLRLLGYSAADVIGQHWSFIVAPGGRAEAARQSAQRRHGLTNSYETRLQTRAGAEIPVLVSATPLLREGHYNGTLALLVDISERKRSELAVAEGERRFRALTTLAPVGIFQTDPDGDYTFVNDHWQRLAGLTAAEAAGRGWAEALHPEDQAPVLADWEAAIAAGRDFDADYRFFTAPARTTWVHASASAIRAENGVITGYIGTVADVTESKAAEQTLTDANERLIESLAEVEQRHQEIALLNSLSGLLQSCMNAEEAAQVIRELVPQLFRGRAGVVALTQAPQPLAEAVAEWGDPAGAQLVFTPADCWAVRRGRLHGATLDAHFGPPCRHVGTPAIYLCAPLLAQGEAVGVLTLLDHTPGAAFSPGEQQLAQTVADTIALALANLRLRETLRHQSVRDALTGLFNRRYMEETLERELRRAARNRTPVGVIVLDLDYFKHFNDTFGHAAGDVLLREMGSLLKRQIRGEDVACRYGGEEFVLILPGAAVETVCVRAEMIRQEAERLDLQHAGHALGKVTLSLGVAVYPENGATPAALLSAGDAALYQAKRHGRNQVSLSVSVSAPAPLD